MLFFQVVDNAQLKILHSVQIAKLAIIFTKINAEKIAHQMIFLARIMELLRVILVLDVLVNAMQGIRVYFVKFKPFAIRDMKINPV